MYDGEGCKENHQKKSFDLIELQTWARDLEKKQSIVTRGNCHLAIALFKTRTSYSKKN